MKRCPTGGSGDGNAAGAAVGRVAIAEGDIEPQLIGWHAGALWRNLPLQLPGSIHRIDDAPREIEFVGIGVGNGAVVIAFGAEALALAWNVVEPPPVAVRDH